LLGKYPLSIFNLFMIDFYGKTLFLTHYSIKTKTAMNLKRLKYAVALNEFPNCPPMTYKELNESAFRWVFRDNLAASFLPLNVIKEPPQRMLDEADLMCKGFGLSLFDTFDHANARYLALYKRKRGISHDDFVAEKGDAIAELVLTGEEGLFGDKNEANGHFTFHEFETTDLTKNVLSMDDIFERNGNFKR
jgi:hypothetical protein